MSADRSTDRARRATWLALAALVGCTPGAMARWSPAQPVATGLAPLAAAAGPLGAFQLIGANATGMRRWTWPFGASGPTAVGDLPLGAEDDEATWPIDRAGDVLAHRHHGGMLEATIVNADGSVGPALAVRPERGTSFQDTSTALGPDGTAIVAWTLESNSGEDPLPTVWLSVRPAGGAFGPVVKLRAPGAVPAFAVDVGADGRPELVVAAVSGSDHYVILHAQADTSGAFAAPVSLATVPADELALLAVIAGGPGRGRVVYGDQAFLRIADDAWAAPQQIGYSDELDVAASLPDGGAVVAAEPGRRLRVRRAPPGGSFGPPETVATTPPCWFSGYKSLAVDAAGDLLLAWDESVLGDQAGCRHLNAFEFGRMRAAFAPAGQPFEPAQTLSPLGTGSSDAWLPVAALGDPDRRFVAWRSERTGSIPDALLAVTGDATADTAAAHDTTEPRLSVAFTRTALRRAVAGAPLRGHGRCSERCAIHVTFGPEFSDDDPSVVYLISLKAIVIAGGGPHPLSWSLNARQRRTARKVLREIRHQGLLVEASAVDAAGNLSKVSRTYLRRG